MATKKEDLRQAALDHAKAGRSVIPARNDPTNPKHKSPLTKHGVLDATRDPRIIANWWGEWPNALIGLACGRSSGVIILDIDNHPNRPSGFDSVPEWLDYGAPGVKTPSGNGVHLYFRHEEGITNCNPFPGVEVRSDGCYCIAPPSPGWIWINGHPPDWSNLPPLPDKFRTMKRVMAAAPDFLHACNSGAGVSTDESDNFAAPTQATVEAALAIIPADCSYQDWMSVGAALKEYPFELFNNWSAQSSKYPGVQKCREKFEEFGKLDQITIATLFHYANEEDPSWRDEIPEEEPSDDDGGSDDDEKPPKKKEKEEEEPLLVTGDEFTKGYVPPSYLIDGIILMSYLYALTAPTGQGKTAVALYMSLMIALGNEVCGHDVRRSKVLYFAGENDVDIRARWIKLCEENSVESCADVVFMPSLQKLSKKSFQKRLIAEATRLGPFGLMIVDTSAAYSEMEDENANMQILAHARAMRQFIKDIPGNPAVIVLCHPVKTPNMDSLLPRGGGAFLAEIDGNLVCKMIPGTMVVDLHTHGKFRGVEFDPMSFELIGGTSDKLVDEKGRKIPTVFARSLDDTTRQAMTDKTGNDQDAILSLMLTSPGLSLGSMAEKLGWFTKSGEPYKTRVYRLLNDALKPRGLVEKDMQDRWKLTQKGEKAAKAPSVNVEEEGY